MIAKAGFSKVSVASFRMTDHCNNMQRLIFMIRQYLSSESYVLGRSANGVFEVERAVREFHLYNPECDVNDDFCVRCCVWKPCAKAWLCILEKKSNYLKKLIF